jgi:hypothetical protein
MLWVVNGGPGGSVAELDASAGQLVRVISGPAYGFGSPISVSSDGAHVWVANLIASSRGCSALTMVFETLMMIEPILSTTPVCQSSR